MVTGVTGLLAATGTASAADGKEKLKQAGASKDFEALLIGQMLRSVREEGSGWLGTGDDEASATAFGLGEEQLAKALTAGGGLGLTKIIEAGLAARSAASERNQALSAKFAGSSVP
jgi:Rod binding domain-containing protein